MSTITHFHGVLITIKADSHSAAYRKLCQILEVPGVEYSTDTYNETGGEEKSTMELTADYIAPCSCDADVSECELHQGEVG